MVYIRGKWDYNRIIMGFSRIIMGYHCLVDMNWDGQMEGHWFRITLVALAGIFWSGYVWKQTCMLQHTKKALFIYYILLY